MITPQIEAIVNTLSARPVRPGFLYGTLKELNTNLDNNSTWPVVCFYPLAPIPSNYTLSFGISNQFAIMMDFYFKTEFDQYTSQNDVVIQNALKMANEFMVKLANYRESETGGRFFKVHKNDRGTIATLYNKFDVNSTGVRLTMTVNTMYNDNVPLS